MCTPRVGETLSPDMSTIALGALGATACGGSGSYVVASVLGGSLWLLWQTKRGKFSTDGNPVDTTGESYFTGQTNSLLPTAIPPFAIRVTAGDPSAWGSKRDPSVLSTPGKGAEESDEVPFRLFSVLTSLLTSTSASTTLVWMVLY